MTNGCDRDDGSLLRGDLVFEDPRGRQLRGESKFSLIGRGEPTSIDTMLVGKIDVFPRLLEAKHSVNQGQFPPDKI